MNNLTPEVPSKGPTLYVCGFLFSEHKQYVLLIHKRQPSWQAGQWNGVGGKIEPGETPIESMHREFKEETGLVGLDWLPVSVLYGRDFEVHFFHAFSDKIFQARSVTEEPVHTFLVADAWGGLTLVPNVRVMLPLALDDTGIDKPVLMWERP